MGCDDVYIVSACRTGIGCISGQFCNTPAHVLGATVIKHCMHRARILPGDVSEVIMGQVLTAGQGQNPARQAAVAADIPMITPAYSVNMLDGSGLKAIHLGYLTVRSGDAKFVVCGGMENMTMAQHSAYIRQKIKFHGVEVQDTMLTDGLIDAFTGLEIGQIADHFSGAYNITREVQDKFAFQSYMRAARALKSNGFLHEIVPVYQITPEIDLMEDQLIQPDITLDKLSEMQVEFEDDLLEEGTITEGNSSANADGAAAVILCNEVQLELLDLVPLVRIVAFAQTAIEPMEIGLGLVKCIEKVLMASGWLKKQVDLFEIDEMFACLPFYVINKLGLNFNKVNVAGGSIALGAPLGASGARVLVTLIHNLHRLGLNRGIAAVGIGGGMAIAVAVDRPKF